MALIAEKFPFVGQTGQCLILGPRERLIYPFDFGDYSEIRVGVFMSMTSGSENNSVIGKDLYLPGTLSNLIYFGFSSYNTGVVFPGSTGGYDYVGVAGFNAASTFPSVGVETVNSTTCAIQGGQSNGSPGTFRFGTTDMTGAQRMLSGTSAVGINLSWNIPTAATGATNFAALFGAQLQYVGGNAIGFKTFSSSTTYYSDVSTAALRTQIANMGTTQSLQLTGFYTSGVVEGAPPMSKPNCFYFYFPTLNQRVRIHNLVIERYA